MKIYIGADSALKRKKLFQRMNRGFDVTVITPEQSTLSYESQMIRTLNLPGMIDVQVTSLNHLLKTLSHDIFTPERETITDIGKKMLFRDILEELSPELRIFRNMDKEGFYEELESTIDKLMQDDVGPEAISQLLDTQESDSLVYNKLFDIHRIYHRFRERMSGEYFDLDQMLQLFETEGHHFRLYSTKEVWFVDFKHFDARTLRMLRAMEAHTEEVCIALAYEADKPWIYAVTHETISLLRDTFPKVEIIRVDSPATPIRQLAEGLHDLSPQEIQAPLRVFFGEDPYEEIEFIGLDILKKLRQDDTLTLEDIRIITSDLSKYEFAIRSIFGQLGLPIFSDERKSISRSRIVKSILALMNVYLDRYRREDVISFLKGYLDESDWDDLDVFENYLIEQGIDYKAFRTPLEEEAMEGLRRRFLGLVLERESFFRERRSVAEFCDGLKQLLLDLDYPQRIEQATALHQERDEMEEALILTQVWNLLMEALAQLQKVAGKKMVGFRKFKTYFDSAIRDLNVGIIPPVEGRITLATLHRSTHAPCRILYFCGMNEGALPKDYLDHGLLKHREKNQIRALGYRYFDTPEFNENLDILDQFVALSLVSDELIFTYAGGNFGSEVLTPSLYVNRAMGLSGAKIERGLQHHYYEHPQTTFRYAVDALREGREEMIHQITAEDLAQIHEVLNAPVVTPPVERPNGVYRASASRLEAFRKCPYNYFVTYDLKPYRRREYVVESFDIGDLYHLLIQQALEAYRVGAMTREIIPVFIDRLMNELVQLEQFRRFTHTAASRYFIEKAKRVAAFVIGVLIENIERSDFVPTYFEKTIQVGLDKIELRGKIDRVDVKDNRFTVIDYKSGSKSFDLNSIYQGIALQLTLYADAFQTEVAMEPAGLFYFNIKDPIVDESKDRETALRLSGITIGDKQGLDHGGEYPYLPAENISPEAMKKLTEHVRRVSQGYVERIRQGDITIKPVRTSTYLNCDYCAYGSICRFDRLKRGFREDRIVKLPKEEIYERLMGEQEKTE